MLSCENIINIAGANKVKGFVAISTDKAVNPTNFMGASKRVCELIALAANQRFPDTSFAVVRFGNVARFFWIGTSYFFNQLKAGGPLTVTDRHAERYIMLVPEAVHLVVKSTLIASRKPEIFVLDMGKPKKILDIAVKLIKHRAKYQLSNRYQTRSWMTARSVSCLPGSKREKKLTEELSSGGPLKPTQFTKILSEEHEVVQPETCNVLTSSIVRACEANDVNQVIELLADPIVGRQSSHEAFAIRV